MLRQEFSSTSKRGQEHFANVHVGALGPQSRFPPPRHLQCLCSMRSRSLATTIKIPCYETHPKYSSQQICLTKATKASSAWLPVVNLICTCSTHAQTQTHMYMDKHICIHLQNSWEDKTATPAWLKEKHSVVPEIARRMHHTSQRTPPRPCFSRERRRSELMVEHTGGDAGG